MATTSTITVSTVARNYEPRWHESYSKELAQGDTSVEVVELSNGESIIRRSHSAQKTVEKHYESVEDVIVDATSGTSKMRKVGITLTFEKGNPTERAATEALAAGFLAKIAVTGELAGLVGGSLKR